MTSETYSYAQSVHDAKKKELKRLQAQSTAVRRTVSLKQKPVLSQTTQLGHLRAITNQDEATRMKKETSVLTMAIDLRQYSAEDSGSGEDVRGWISSKCALVVNSVAFGNVMTAAVVVATMSMLDPDAARVHARRSTASVAWLVIDMACTCLFALEVVVKTGIDGVAFPLWPCTRETALGRSVLRVVRPHLDPRLGSKEERFFGSFWDANDFAFVAATGASYLIGFAARDDSAATARALRLLGVVRCGRPLRLIAHVPTLVETITSLYASLKSLATVAFAAVMCWITFALVGMQCVFRASPRWSRDF